MAQIETDICWSIPTIQNETDGSLGPQYGNSQGSVYNINAMWATSYNFDTLLSMVQLVVLICLPFIFTYLYTFVQSISTQKSEKVGKRAPVVPYAIPIVGHTMMFIWSLNNLIKKNT